MRGWLPLAALMAMALSGQDVVAQTGDQERQQWHEALAQGSARSFEMFLDRYPSGRYAGEAFRCLVETRLDPDSGGCAIEPGGGPPASRRTLSGNYLADIP